MYFIFLCSSFSTYSELQEMMEFGPIIYNADGSCVNSILGRLLEKRPGFELKSQNNLQTRYFTVRTWPTWLLKRRIKFEICLTKESNTKWRWILSDRCQRHQVWLLDNTYKSFNEYFQAVGFGRSDKDSEREKMLDPVNDGEEEFDEEGVDTPFTQHEIKYLFF